LRNRGCGCYRRHKKTSLKDSSDKKLEKIVICAFVYVKKKSRKKCTRPRGKIVIDKK
jgi:hypothetical protein